MLAGQQPAWATATSCPHRLPRCPQFRELQARVERARCDQLSSAPPVSLSLTLSCCISVISVSLSAADSLPPQVGLLV